MTTTEPTVADCLRELITLALDDGPMVIGLDASGQSAQHAATAMRDACVEKVKEHSYYHDSRCACVMATHGPCDCGAKGRFDKLVLLLSLLTLNPK